MGLVEQLAQFTPHISAAATPLRPLLKPSNDFIWTSDHDAAFNEVKSALVSPPVLSQFDPSLETVLQTDASKLNGIGYALLQKHGEQWKLVECGSRFLTDTESRYSVPEIELRGVEWSMKKCRLYLLGLPKFKLITDHQALVTILDRHTLDAVEQPRLQRMKERLSPYVFETVWRKGAEHAVPDALSRAPISDPSPEDVEVDNETSTWIRRTVRVCATELNDAEESAADHLSDPVLEQLRSVAEDDLDYQALLTAVTDGFPSQRSDAHPFVKQFWAVRHDLSAEDGLVLFENRLVIPSAARRDVLNKLHASHQGIERTKRRARHSVYWPAINTDIANTVAACSSCQERLPSQQRESLKSDPAPSRVFEDVSADLFLLHGKYYLVYSDRLSGWPIIDSWTRCPNSQDLIRVVARSFVALGVPVRFRSDGGTQFDSKEFKTFLEKWGVRLGLSTPHYAQSNGHAEAAVKAMKTLIAKSTKNGNLDEESFQHGLLEWRNTPRSDGRSPAQFLFGHNLRSLVPTHRSSFAPEWQSASNLCDQKAAADSSKITTDYNEHARDLPPLTIGTTVRVQDHVSKLWDKVGIIVSVGRHRDYRVKFPSGGVLWRNRRFLRPTVAEVAVPTDVPVPAVDARNPAPSSPPPLRRGQRTRKPRRPIDV